MRISATRWMSRFLENRTLTVVSIVFGTGLALWIGVLVLTFRGDARVFELGQQSFQASQRVLSFKEVLLELQNAESHQRAFLLTGDRGFLASYSSSTLLVQQELTKIQSLFSGDPRRASVALLIDLVQLRLSLLNKVLDPVPVMNSKKLSALIRSDAGPKVMDEVESLARKLESEDLAVRSASISEARRQLLQSFYIDLAGTVITTFFFLVAAGLTVFYLRNRRRIEEQLLLAQREAEGASRLKSDFLANMSHEIRTPLNGIIGMSQLLSDERIDAGLRQYVDGIKTSADSLLYLVNDILDFSKIEAGKLEIDVEDFKWPDLMTDCERVLRYAAERKGLTLSFSSSDGIPTVRGDRRRLLQVLMNLVSNAIKFTETGSVTVSTQATVDSEEVRLKVEVSDTGIGVSGEVAARLFHPFSQADASSRKRFGGTGLGLSISKKLIELMGGAIGMRPAEGRGSVFWFELRLEKAASALPAPSFGDISRLGEDHSRMHFSAVSGERKRILVVEDNEMNRQVMLRMLEKLQYDVESVSSGAEAIAAVESRTWDLILMDCQMPGMDGYEAARRIRRLQSVKNSPKRPILAVTASVAPGERERCLAAGMDDYLAKPIDLFQLKRSLARWLEGQRQGIDTAALKKLSALSTKEGDDVVNEFVSLFLRTAPQRIEAVRSALERKDVASVAREAHTLKSSCAYVGAISMKDICEEIESRATQAVLTEVADLFARLEKEFAETKAALLARNHDNL